ncbi:sensor histidine kinase [Ideonella sp. A 288]|uniref:sensor histidine kinase n=1 Tax=Ideonella sp. A 288 TaxID=1962181 RepID=UPI000B4AE756|nr:ATP-binding protein [Ideonella sp. A 288]
MNGSIAFDRELTLPEVVRGLPLDRVAAALEILVGAPVGIEDPTGRIVAGHAVPGGQAIPVELEIEPLGVLRVQAGQLQQGAAAATLLKLLLHARAQVIRAGDLHASAMSTEYDALRERHEALQQSEARYRELVQSLEERVKQQVALLDERQRQIYLAERLASVGQLAAGIAHEINNPIGFILSNLETGRRYLPKLHELRATLTEGTAAAASWQTLDLDFVAEDLGDLMADCIVGAQRIARIVRDVKGFSSIDRPDPEDVDLNAQLATVVAIIAAQKPAGVALTEHYADGMPPLLCLPGHLNQVFVNLINNAVQSVEGREGGRVEVHTRHDGADLRVEVIDNGVGIAPEVLPRVFDPFFTTRGVGRGVGLGLTVARDIVGAHGGRLVLSSLCGQGTTASVSLPLTPTR